MNSAIDIIAFKQLTDQYIQTTNSLEFLLYNHISDWYEHVIGNPPIFIRSNPCLYNTNVAACELLRCGQH
jgi:hypothetical protein